MNRRHHIKALGLALGATLIGLSSFAQAQSQPWPSQPIKLLIGYAPGGPVDTTGRIFAKYFSEVLKTPVVVENRPGAGAMIAADATAKANPDGYLLNFVASPAVTIAPVVQKSKLFDPRKDLTYIGSVVQYTNVLVTGVNVPANSVKELVEYAQKNPTAVTYGSAGIGSSNHLSAELLSQSAKAPMLHVPYKGSNPALMDVVGGKITFMFDMPITIVPHIQAGKIKPLAVTSKQRLPSMPNVPTMIEAGIADYEVVGWFGLMGPKGLPADVTNKLKAAIDTVTQNPEFRETIQKAGYAIVVEDGNTLTARVVRELAVWEKVVADAKIN